MHRASLTLALFVGIAVICSCRSPAPETESSRAGGSMDQAAAAPTGGSRLVTRILFLELTDPCQCTKDRQEKTWGELMRAVEGTDIEVERVRWDTEGERAEAYAEKRPFTVIPVLYFLDGEGGLVDMIQGEATIDQIRKAAAGGSGQCSPGLDCQ